MNKEGFWWWEHEPHLPMPVEQAEPVSPGFLNKLAFVESNAEGSQFRGISTCRLCGQPNGNAEFEYKGWRWPEGLAHYLTAHNVHPSAAFVKMIEEA